VSKSCASGKVTTLPKRIGFAPAASSVSGVWLMLGAGWLQKTDPCWSRLSPKRPQLMDFGTFGAYRCVLHQAPEMGWSDGAGDDAVEAVECSTGVAGTGPFGNQSGMAAGICRGARWRRTDRSRRSFGDNTSLAIPRPTAAPRKRPPMMSDTK
jgi:hypothetical protein